MSLNRELAEPTPQCGPDEDAVVSWCMRPLPSDSASLEHLHSGSSGLDVPAKRRNAAVGPASGGTFAPSASDGFHFEVSETKSCETERFGKRKRRMTPLGGSSWKAMWTCQQLRRSIVERLER